MRNRDQSLKPEYSARPQDASSNLANSSPTGRKVWLCVLGVAVIALSFLNNSCDSCGNGKNGGGDGGNGRGDCYELPSDTLPEYTAKCTVATGVEVPAFNCDDGTLVPENHLTGTYPNQFCDAPNVLNEVCDPGSRFQVLVQTADVAIVGHCRKQNNADGFYGDIAVIQYNKKNGATCFYQALGNLPAQVTAPSQGNGAGQFPWLDPASTADIQCVRCHDNGPFVRSPYLAQLRDEPKNRLPGTKEDDGEWDQRFTWNKSLPYKFVGNDFQSWKVYELSITGTGSGCTQCHRLGVHSINGNFTSQGTALELGLIATAKEQAHKNPHSPDAPIWMKPYQEVHDPDAESQAIAAAACAEAVVALGNDPNAPPLPPGCSSTEFGKGDVCAFALEPFPQSPDSRWLIARVTGDWSSTRNNATIHSYADFYTGPSKDVRLRGTNGVDRVGAYASWGKLN